jgi:hypothetical protein
MRTFIAVVALLIAPAVSNANENKIAHSEKSVKSMTVAQFKGECMRMRGMLSYENKQWVCNGKSVDDGLTSMPVMLPK